MFKENLAITEMLTAIKNDKDFMRFKHSNEFVKGREKAIAYKLKDIVKYESPRELSYYGIKAAPQSFVYISS